MGLSIRDEIDRIKELLNEIKLETTKFYFQYNNLKIRTLFFLQSETFLFGIEDYSKGWMVAVNNGEIGMAIPNDIFLVIVDSLKNEEGKITTLPLFESLRNKMSMLQLNDLSRVTTKEILGDLKLMKTNDKKYDEEGENTYFSHWRRNGINKKTRKKITPSPSNLEKTKKVFGREIKDLCRKNRITSVWDEDVKEKSLDFLNIEKVKYEIINLI